jgi:hypothetical protein
LGLNNAGFLVGRQGVISIDTSSTERRTRLPGRDCRRHQPAGPHAGAQTIVPGHGPVCGPQVIDDTLGYLRFIQEVARQGWDAGRTPLEAAREIDLGEYADLLDTERIVGNLYRAYVELAGAERGVRIDSTAALKDMVAYTGAGRSPATPERDAAT